MNNGESSYRRYLDGEEDALYELVRDYKDGLAFYINSIVRNITLAEELMLDTFAKLIIKRPRFSGESSFKTWLYAIARNLALDALKKNSKAPISLDEVETYIGDTESLEIEYLRTERNAQLRRAMDKLKPEHTQSLWLVYFEDFSYADAARVMKKTRHQFDSLIYRAKKSLRSELEKEGFVYDEL